MRFTILMNVAALLASMPSSAAFSSTTGGCSSRTAGARMFLLPRSSRSTSVLHNRSNSAAAVFVPSSQQTSIPSHISTTLLHQSRNNNNDESNTRQTQEQEQGLFSNITLNPTYTIAYLIFFSVATYMTTTETPGASQEIIEKFIANPLHPNIGSSLFEVIFNTLGLIGLPLACLIMPGSKGQRFNPTPFLFGSAAAGYGSLGLFMMTRKPVTSVSGKDLGWFTRNVLENKLFNWLLVLALANIYWITGAGESLYMDASGTLDEFRQLIGGSALGFVSTVDLTILCLTGVSLIPEDLERRGVFKEELSKAYAVAASTLLLPAVGLALYTALRPSLVLEDE
jgi:hypothetical protein